LYSTLFTHEFPRDAVDGSRILTEKSEVLPPIVERFQSLGRKPIGRYLCSWIGAIWDAEHGIPVIPHTALMRLVSAEQ
jgi:hypothetical protein